MYCKFALLLSSFIFVRGQDPCDQAIETLQSSEVCETSSVTAMCSEECLYLFDDIIQNCDGRLALSHSTWINIVCYDIVPDCAALQDALNLDLTTSCVIAIEYMDPRTFCSGTCSNLLHASVDACPRNVTISIGSFNQRNELIVTCIGGGGSHGNALQASGILILLPLLMCTLIS